YTLGEVKTMRKPTWTWYHTEQELHHAYRHAPHPQATRRLYALSLLRRGCTPTQVAHLMGVSRATLYRWYHWYATEGLECLQTRTHGGARRQATSLTPAQAEQHGEHRHRLRVWG
ncbi:MAG: helix-turn-helix domain-containing protein, partial [Fimbriimonadales bacterium]|nr:helix-turn-helix domain-containing protein [Fimbriimonadales bacterium]